MERDNTTDKVSRVLGLYTKLINGGIVNKAEEANNYGVNERSIQRDIDDIRNFMDLSIKDAGVVNSVVYDRAEKGYRLEKIYQLKFSNSEILAICKILLESRAFTKKEMEDMLDKLIDCCVPEKSKRLVKELISNEAFHYVEPRHKTRFIDSMWDLGQAIRNCNYVEIQYERIKDRRVVSRRIKPVAILFSEYYFYLTAFIDDDKLMEYFDVVNDSYPTIYRLDRIKSISISEEKFHIPYKDRFEEGEFRKRIQFMYGGKLQKVTFEYFGKDVDSILDRLPTAQIVTKNEESYVIKAEVFGKGIEMWIRSQGNMIKVIEGK